MFAEDDSSGADASSRSAPLPPPSPNATGRMGSELVLQEEQPAAPPSGGALVALAVLPGLGAPTQYNTTYPRSKLWEDPDASTSITTTSTRNQSLRRNRGSNKKCRPSTLILMQCSWTETRKNVESVHQNVNILFALACARAMNALRAGATTPGALRTEDTACVTELRLRLT